MGGRRGTYTPWPVLTPVWLLAGSERPGAAETGPGWAGSRSPLPAQQRPCLDTSEIALDLGLTLPVTRTLGGRERGYKGCGGEVLQCVCSKWTNPICYGQQVVKKLDWWDGGREL